MRPCRESARQFAIEAFEQRVLFATTWGPTARLVNQDDAARVFSSIAGQGIAVAVIDSGINYNHPSLGGGFGPGHKVVAGFDFVDNDPDPLDTQGHGTEVAGIVAASPFDSNGLHYSGVAPGANLVALRVSRGDNGSTDAIVERALNWVIDNHQTYNIKIVNISLGGGMYASDHVNATVSDEFQRLAALDILVVAASGNSNASGTGITYPAADANVVSVGAVNSGDAISSFTQRARILDLLAAGEGVVSTSAAGGYELLNGTSFASPEVAGAAALIRQADPTLTRDETLSILRASGVTNRDGDNESGQTTGLYFPRLDIYNALKMVNARRTSAKFAAGTTAVVSDIAYDEQDVLHLAYYDPSVRSVRYATRGTDGLWSRTQIVDTGGATVGTYLSIAIDSTGKPGIAYYDVTNADLKYAHFNGARWDVAALDRTGTMGLFPSLAYDHVGNPVIAYYRKTGGDLRAMMLDASGRWTRMYVDSAGDVGTWADVSVSDSGAVGVAYADQTNGNLKYASFDGGQWNAVTVDDLSGVAYIDLNLHNEQPNISYQDLARGDLKFARRDGAQWLATTVYSSGSTGQFSSLLFDRSNLAHIAFWSQSKNAIYEAIGAPGAWTIKRLTAGGYWLSSAATTEADTLTYVSLNPIRRSLQFGVLS